MRILDQGPIALKLGFMLLQTLMDGLNSAKPWHLIYECYWQNRIYYWLKSSTFHFSLLTVDAVMLSDCNRASPASIRYTYHQWRCRLTTAWHQAWVLMQRGTNSTRIFSWLAFLRLSSSCIVSTYRMARFSQGMCVAFPIPMNPFWHSIQILRQAKVL